MANSSAWFALGGALGAVALTGVISLVTSMLNHRWSNQDRIQTQREHEISTIRDQRREACHSYLVGTSRYYRSIDRMYRKAISKEPFHPYDDVREAITGMQDAYVYLTISAGAEVRHLAQSYNKTLYDLADAAREGNSEKWIELKGETQRARDRVRSAMRAELDVPD